jgi:nucleotide-binding universal stress UspA family protein
MKFLVPTDFSLSANNAGRFASSLAQATNSDMIVIHIIEPYKGPKGTDLGDGKKKALNQLYQWKQNLQKEYKVKIYDEIKIGILKEEIILAAKNNKADLIIMGTVGSSGLDKLIWGSNTVHVIKKSQIPVLAIPKNINFSIPSKIVFATDYNNSDINDLRQLSNLAQYFNAEIKVIHVSEHITEADGYLSLEQYFSDLVKNNLSYSNISFDTIQNSNTIKGLRLFLKEEKADIFALAIRKRNIFQQLFGKSMTEEFLFKIKIPTLAFHIVKQEEENSEF